MDLKDNKFLSAALLFLGTIIFAKLLSVVLVPKSKKRLPPTIKALPVVGGLLRFMKGPIVMIMVNVLNRRITFFVGPEVSAHFFNAQKADLSKHEVYQFNVSTFRPGVVFDVDYSVWQEQFRFFTEAPRVTKLTSYIDQMVVEVEDYFSKRGESDTVDQKYELEHLIILTTSICLFGREVRDKLFDDVSTLLCDLDNMHLIRVIFPDLPIPTHHHCDRAQNLLVKRTLREGEC